MLEVLGSDYIKFARLKGLHEQVVLWKHGLKNALLPVTTFAVMLFVQFLGGAVVTETVFAWPGLGRLILEIITTRDYPVVQAGVLVLSAPLSHRQSVRRLAVQLPQPEDPPSHRVGATSPGSLAWCWPCWSSPRCSRRTWPPIARPRATSPRS